MVCTKCGNKISDGVVFCQNCGTRVEKNHDLQNGNNTCVVDANNQGNHSTPAISSSTQPVNDENKLKWYLSIPFLFITLLICFPISIVLSIVRFTKTKGTERHRATLVYITCAVVLFVGISFLMISEEKTFDEIDTAIANGQYETAYTLIKQAERNNESTFRVKDSYIKYYEAQKLYDEAADVLIKYYEKDSEDSNFQNTIAQLNKIIELVSSEKKSEIQTFISDIENQKKILAEAKEREKAEKEEAKKAAAEVKKAAEEAKAREKAQKEAEKKVEAEAKAKEKAEKEVAIQEKKKSEETAKRQSSSGATRSPMTAQDKFQERINNAIQVSATKLEMDYKSNEISANQKYKGKDVVVTGVIESVAQTFGMPQLVLMSAEQFSAGVTITLEKSELSKAANLSPRQRVRVLGVCDGTLMGMVGVSSGIMIQ